MKIRNGFVSNSSSSSFVIRGIRIKKDELAKCFNVESYNQVSRNLGGIVIRDTSNYFSGEESDDCIIGSKIGELEDGDVLEISNTNNADDANIIAALKRVGVNTDGILQLSTFVQYVSNDNY